MRWIVGGVLGLALMYGVACLGLYLAQRSMLYVPGRDLEAPAAYGLADVRAVPITAEDGGGVLVWHRAAASGMPTIVLFHGNGGHLAYRVPLLKEMAALGLGIVALEYRGYGPNEGSPSEDGLYRDARAALAFARSQGVPEASIVLYGESLGTGVAVEMALDCGCAALVLQSPYSSMADAVRTHVPFVPVDWLLADRYDSLAKIGRVKMPILVMHGENDAVVPMALGRRLFDAAAEPKEATWFADFGHNDLNPALLASRLMAFLRPLEPARTDFPRIGDTGALPFN